MVATEEMEQPSNEVDPVGVTIPTLMHRRRKNPLRMTHPQMRRRKRVLTLPRCNCIEDPENSEFFSNIPFSSLDLSGASSLRA